ncbi:MAG TPA: hypothetical protein ENN87_14095 [Phycisphaerales bacterium]|nr:hypothetical protein [Phycisphaerales bacterium]
MTDGSVVHHYYVDEAGDLTLFDKRGRILVGTPGVSQFFFVGVAHLPDPEHAAVELDTLRRRLLADPYFQGVPSMQPATKKTALCFHAKNDLPEVRREVFRLLPTLNAKVQVAIRRKLDLAKMAQSASRRLGQKLSPDRVYDDLVKRLFRNLLHKADENRVVFSIRGNSTRQVALERALDRARANFRKKFHIATQSHLQIRAAYPHEVAGLQVVDYYLWALQRMFERHEDRFFNLLGPGFRLIMDLDDQRNKGYGEWYSDSNPLTLEKIKPTAG